MGAHLHLLQDLCMLAMVLAFFAYCIIVLAMAIQSIIELRACHYLITCVTLLGAEYGQTLAIVDY